MSGRCGGIGFGAGSGAAPAGERETVVFGPILGLWRRWVGRRRQHGVTAAGDGLQGPTAGHRSGDRGRRRQRPGRGGLPGLTPTVLVLQQPVDLLLHPAAQIARAQARTGCTCGGARRRTRARASPGHAIDKLPSRRHPLIQPLLQAWFRAPGAAPIRAAVRPCIPLAIIGAVTRAVAGFVNHGRRLKGLNDQGGAGAASDRGPYQPGRWPHRCTAAPRERCSWAAS